MIKLGIDRIDEYKKLFEGKRIGLITNFSGVSSDFREDLKCFKDCGYNVTKVFTPEHGLYAAGDGDSVDSFVHPVYNIPVISLYGEKNTPSKEDLSELDLLVYDIQDVGLRYYTYIYTLCNCMKAASESGLKVVVLDRPNPLGSKVSGNVMKSEYDSFVGAHGLTIRYGLTIGELGHYFKDYLGLSLEYDVVLMKEYDSKKTWRNTKLPWNIPSPSIHTFDTVLCYNGGCFFEATNISEGRGTAIPFQFYGAPYVDSAKLVSRLREQINDEKLGYKERAFTPFWSKHAGQVCFGVEFMPLSDELDFMFYSLITMKAFKDLYPDQFEFKKYADVQRLTSLSGDITADDYLNDKISLSEIKDIWNNEASVFEQKIKKYRIYNL